MVKRRTIVAALAFALLAPIWSGAQQASEPTPPPAAAPAGTQPVIVILLYGVTWADLLDPKHSALNALAMQGAVGLLCTRTAARTPNHESAVLTLAAGSRVTCEQTGDLAGLALGSGEGYAGRPAANLYAARTGLVMGTSQVAYLAGAAVLHENQQQAPTLHLGQVGDALHGRGQLAAVLGNADLPGLAPHRYAAAVAMDSRGLVGRGDMGEGCLLPDVGPVGVKTNYDYLLERVQALAAECRLIVIETGDTDRLSRLAPQLPEAVVTAARAEALGALDAFLGKLMPVAAAQGWRLLLVSSGADNGNSNTLQPVALWGRNIPSGLLGSDSTRLPWLGSTLDVVPTLIERMHVDPVARMVGQPLEAMPAQGNTMLILDLEQRVARAEAARPVVAKVVVVLLILLLAVGAGALLLPGWGRSWQEAARVGLLTAGWLPLACLWWPLAVVPLPVAAVGVPVTALALALAARLLGRGAGGVLAGVTIVVVTLDLLLGGRLMAGSALGYSLTAGARFYGLGNEYGGLLLGAAVLPAAALAAGEGRGRLIAGVLLLLVLGALAAWGMGGANFGIGSALAVTALALLWLRSRQRALAFLGAVLAVLAAGCLMLLLEYRSAGESHIGRMAAILASGGTAEAWAMVVRKLTMNWTLVRFSDWLYVLVAAAVALAARPLARPAQWLPFARAHPGRALAAALLPIAALAAFALNDSGLLAAAVTLSTGAAVIGSELLVAGKEAPEGKG